MIIAIRKEPNGSLYMDKEIYSRTQEVQDEQGNIIIQSLFSEETLSRSPYNYTKVEIDDKYSDCQASDFNDDLTFSIEKYNTRKQKELAEPGIAELKQLLAKSDYKLLKCLEGEISLEDYEPIRLQRKAWRDEINSLGG